MTVIHRHIPPCDKESHGACRDVPEVSWSQPRQRAPRTLRVLELLAIGLMDGAAIAAEVGCSRQYVSQLRLAPRHAVTRPARLVLAFPDGGPHDDMRDWFMDRVSFVDDDHSCWHWTGSSTTKRGLTYGIACGMRANRVALEIATRELIAPGLHALHGCDNPICVRPSHLRAGTPKQNMDEKVARGRHRTNPRKGDDHRGSKIPDADVVGIRAEVASGGRGTTSAIARRYGVAPATITKIVLGRARKHIARAA